MKIKCKIVIECMGDSEASAINKALSLDNETYMTSKAIGSKIIADIESDDVFTLSNTINDFLSCLNVSKNSCSVITDNK